MAVVVVQFHRALQLSENHLLKRWSELCLSFFCFIFIRWYLEHKNEVLVHWPILEFIPSILKNQHRIHEWSVELFNSVGSTIVARGPIFARLNLVYTGDLRNAEYITKINFSNFPKGADYIEIFDVIGNGIFNMEYEHWQAQRKLANTTLMSKEFRSYVAKTTFNA
ncbi:Cytochrome p450, partial [Thalictrum thalictroides]